MSHLVASFLAGGVVGAFLSAGAAAAYVRLDRARSDLRTARGAVKDLRRMVLRLLGELIRAGAVVAGILALAVFLFWVGSQ